MPVSLLCLMIMVSGDMTGGDGHSTASEKLSINTVMNTVKSYPISQDKNPSHPEEYQTKKEVSKDWIWWYSVHMAAESTEQKSAFRKRLEDQKKKQELTNDTRVWWYEVSEAMDKYTGQPKKEFWKEEEPDYE